jgi:hypothetical protein
MRGAVFLLQRASITGPKKPYRNIINIGTLPTGTDTDTGTIETGWKPILHCAALRTIIPSHSVSSVSSVRCFPLQRHSTTKKLDHR